MEKYGFVYLWFDRKHNRFYIGCRWGNVNDSYICSSRWMNKSYKRRPQDFKRRILKTNIQSRAETLEIEFRYLSMINENELGTKYYNLSKHHFGHWSATPRKQTIAEKISISHKNDPEWGKWAIGKVLSEEAKEKIREANKKQFSNPEAREYNRQKALAQWADPEYRKARSEEKKGIKQSSETITKRVEKLPKKTVRIDGIEYVGVVVAAKILGKKPKWVSYHDEINGYNARKNNLYSPVM